MLLIDELDRADEPFEAFLLELLSEFQITIPGLGTVKAASPPIVILTSNRAREVHDAVKRRCRYHWVGFPDAARELQILQRRVPGAAQALAGQIVAFGSDACLATDGAAVDGSTVAVAALAGQRPVCKPPLTSRPLRARSGFRTRTTGRRLPAARAPDPPAQTS